MDEQTQNALALVLELARNWTGESLPEDEYELAAIDRVSQFLLWERALLTPVRREDNEAQPPEAPAQTQAHVPTWPEFLTRQYSSDHEHFDRLGLAGS